MFNERKSARYPSHARARIEGAFEGDALLKDLSVTGCCIECTMIVDIKPNAIYKIEILPETASNIGNFELKVEARWTRIGGYSCEVGFMIVASPKGKLFQRYVDYLTWRSA
ncbi:MAG: PilZ domain-containing protein [Spirochaetaceae bacterium]|nr:PilZ domain-containing protein [Spirochaetaceae bacterium]